MEDIPLVQLPQSPGADLQENPPINLEAEPQFAQQPVLPPPMQQGQPPPPDHPGENPPDPPGQPQPVPPGQNAQVADNAKDKVKIKVESVAKLDSGKPGTYPKWVYKLKCTISAACSKATIGRVYIGHWESDLKPEQYNAIIDAEDSLTELDSQVFSAVYCSITGRRESVITERIRSQVKFGRGLDLLRMLDVYFMMDSQQKRSEVVAEFMNLRVLGQDVGDMEEFLTSFRKLREESHLHIPKDLPLPEDHARLGLAVQSASAEILARACRRIPSWSQAHDVWVQVGSQDGEQLLTLMEKITVEKSFHQYKSQARVGRKQLVQQEEDYPEEQEELSEEFDPQCVAQKGKSKGASKPGGFKGGKGKSSSPVFDSSGKNVEGCFRCGAHDHWIGACSQALPLGNCKFCGSGTHATERCWWKGAGKGKGKSKGKSPQMVSVAQEESSDSWYYIPQQGEAASEADEDAQSRYFR